MPSEGDTTRFDKYENWLDTPPFDGLWTVYLPDNDKEYTVRLCGLECQAKDKKKQYVVFEVYNGCPWKEDYPDGLKLKKSAKQESTFLLTDKGFIGAKWKQKDLDSRAQIKVKCPHCKDKK